MSGCAIYGEKNDRGIELEVPCNFCIIHMTEFSRNETKSGDSKILTYLLDYIKSHPDF